MAKKIKGITIEIGGDTTGLDKALKSVDKSAKDLQSELRGVNSLLKLDPSNVNLLKQKQDILNQSLAETKNKLKILEDSQEKVNQKWQKYGENKERIAAVDKEITETKKTLADLKKEQEETTQKFKEGKVSEEQYQKINSAVSECQKHLSELQKEQKQLNEETVNDEQYRDYQREVENTKLKIKSLEKQIKEFGSVHSQQIAAAGEKMQSYGEKIESAGKKISGASAVTGAAIAGVVKGAAEWETAFTGVQKTVDGTSEQMGKLEQDLLDLSKRTASSSTDIAAVAEAAGQLGIKTDDIAGFTEVMVMLGDSTNLSADEAAQALAKLANITKMSSDKYSNLGATIVDLGNNFATTEKDIVEMTTRLASTGSVIGLTEPQMLAIATALSSVGIEAEAGGSAISKLLKKMETSVATNKEAEEVIKKTGYSLRDLQLMASLSSSDFKGVAESLGLTTEELKTFMNNADGLNKFAEVSGMTAAEFKKAYEEDAVGALSKFINGLSSLDESGGSAVATLQDMGLTEVRLSNAVLALSSSNDILGQSLDTANGAWKENTALSEEAERKYSTTESKITQLKNTLTELATKLGDLLLPIVTSVVDKLKDIIEKFTNMNPVIQKIILVIAGIVTAIGPLLIFIGKIATGIGGVLKIAPKIVSVVGKVKGIITGLKGTITGLFSANPVGLIIAAIAALIAILVTLYNHCEPFKKFVDELWDKIKTFFTETLPNAFASLKEKISEAIESIKGFVSGLVDKIRDFFTVQIPNAIQSVIQWFTDLPYKIGYAIGLIIGHIARFAVDAFNFFTVKLPEYIQKAIEWFKSLPEKIKNAISNAVTNIANWTVQMKDKAVNGVKNLISNTITFFKELPTKIKNAIASAITNIGTWCSDMKTKASNGIKEVVKKITDGFKNLPQKMKDIGKNVVEGIWNGIKNAKDWIVKKIKSFADGVLKGFKDGFDIHSPSRRLEKEVGEELPPGMAKGIENKADEPINAMKDIADEMVDIPQFNGITLKRQLNTTFSASMPKSGLQSMSVADLALALKEAIKYIEFPLYLNGKKLVDGIAYDMDEKLGVISREKARGC